MNLLKLEQDLWEAADNLRANSKLTAAQYAMPVLGLIFLRHACNRFLAVKAEIEPNLPARGGKPPRELRPNDFIGKAAIYLPPQAQYDYLVAQPEGTAKADAIVKAMELVEEHNNTLKGALPKDYRGFEPKLLSDLVKIFNRDNLRKASGDVFGKIYEYFLNKFAQSGAQEGGEFFTPPSLVRMIVNVIEPDHGIVFDPACGSGGMFVQTGHFLEVVRHTQAKNRVVFYGQEKAEVNNHLARMNLAVHGLEGEIRQANTFYDEWPERINACDFVMANPPFNVDGVDTDRIKAQLGEWDDAKPSNHPQPGKRLPFGLPGVNAKTKAISNANSLWIEYFYAYLNATGRAGFVMASSASDAGNKDKDIRRRLVSTGHVDVMIAIGNKFFYTRSLPCTLWFFDKGKKLPSPAGGRGFAQGAGGEGKTQANDGTALNTLDRVLMIDARNVYHVESARHHRFTEEQLANLNAIVWLHRGEGHKFREQVARWQHTAHQHLDAVEAALAGQGDAANSLLERLAAFAEAATPEQLNAKRPKPLRVEEATAVYSVGDAVADEDAVTQEQLAAYRAEIAAAQAAQRDAESEYAGLVQRIVAERKAAHTPQDTQELTTQHATQARLEALAPVLKSALKSVETSHKSALKLLDQAEKTLRARHWPEWDGKTLRELKRQLQAADPARDEAPTPRDVALQTLKDALHFIAQGHWLLHRFPEGRFADVAGLCKSVTVAEIEANDWSLTPGRYVGVAADAEEDEEDFKERIESIRCELRELADKSMALNQAIDDALAEFAR